MALWTAFTIGLFGSLHCLGMCGPIALALPYHNESKIKSFLNVMTYNSGRAMSYAMLGLIPGILGMGIQMAGYQKYLSIGFGILFVIAGILSINLERRVNSLGFIKVINQKVQKSLGHILKNRSGNMLSIGILNGFLPCGLVYAALAGALAASSIGGSMLYMAIFGLGTIPMMLLITSAGSLAKVNLRNKLRKLSPVLLVAFGLLFLMRGFNVDLPMDLENWLFMGGATPDCN